jgi:hypothetical protein
MPQIVSGIYIGNPGPVGSRPIVLLYSAVDPDSSTDPQLGQCRLGSLLVQFTTPSLWQKTDETESPTHPNGVWTQIS